MVKKWLQDNDSNTKHFESIEKEDFSEKEVFRYESAVKFRQEAWFSIVYHFTFRRDFISSQSDFFYS